MFLGSSQIYYYLGTGLLFTAGSAVVYNGWDYYAPRQNNKIICLAHINTNLLACLWLIQGILMLACCVSYSVFTSYDAKSKKKTFLVTYSALFLKVCPKVVKLLHLFNFCQLFAIIFDLLILPECNSYKLRYLFVIALSINWLIAIWGLMLRKRILLPPFVYDPATYKKGYLTSLRDFIEPMGI
ncbi:putative integral membrane protein [Theileria parva strain Muguga]|uniref:putative integral membrane protein n=1 Tax=Theileria parva strain Muguga TaxID=333668 RepID=UPI001C61FBBD|nr:putative integral membrane protein [Theileria parva strain Muguga]KAF5153129.1 putative integral membrane protein [Theileria parva strain Muguga]